MHEDKVFRQAEGGVELIDIKKTSLYNKFICLKSYGGSYERNQL